jgi:hypothetical protein
MARVFERTVLQGRGCWGSGLLMQFGGTYFSFLMLIKGNETSGAEEVPLSWLPEIAEVIYK